MSQLEPANAGWDARVAEARRRLDAGDAAGAAALIQQGGAGVPDQAAGLLAAALRRLGRAEDAIPLLERDARARPTSSVAEHNLAAALGDVDRLSESEAAARRALLKGGSAPQTWLVLARALVGLGRLDEAEAAFKVAIRFQPDYVEAMRELVQLQWMRHGDAERLQSDIQPLRRLAAGDPAAAIALSTVLRATLGDVAALAAVASWIRPGQPHPDVALAAMAPALELDPTLALALAAQVLQARPTPEATVAYAYALLACRRSPEAAALLEQHLVARPHDQVARGLLDAAWRECEDPRALAPDDYGRLVRFAPVRDGLAPSAEADWLDDLAARLGRLHPFAAPPVGQSIRGGAQSRLDPRAAGDPAIDRLFGRLQGLVEDYVGEVAESGAAVGRAWRMSGAWSVRLRTGGRHVDHVHPQSWISSAFYVDLPEPRGREGWLRFGAAPVGGGRTLPAQHWIEPRRGWLVLFPSWLWHGTEPFRGCGERLSVAFNIDRA